MSELADLIERFRRGAALVAVATCGAAGAVVDFRAAVGTWGVRTVVGHLADTEEVLSMRLRQVIAEDNPVLPAIDQDAWARNVSTTARGNFLHALDTFRRTRAENYELLKELPEEMPARTAHSTAQRGTITLLDLSVVYSPSILKKHVQQIQRGACRLQGIQSCTGCGGSGCLNYSCRLRLSGDRDDGGWMPRQGFVDATPQPHKPVIEAHLVPLQAAAFQNASAHEPGGPRHTVKPDNLLHLESGLAPFCSSAPLRSSGGSGPGLRRSFRKRFALPAPARSHGRRD